MFMVEFANHTGHARFNLLDYDIHRHAGDLCIIRVF
jgi:hypothetical protein